MPELPSYQHRIAGEDVAPASGQYLPSENPYTGEEWYTFARGNAEDADKAVAAARAAQIEWAARGPVARGKTLLALADLLEREVPKLAELEVRDNGKLMSEMTVLSGALGAWFRYYGGLADKIEGSVVSGSTESRLIYTRHEPLGVIAMITPWNSPLNLLVNKLAPALAAGNAAVIKPSEFTTVSTLELVKLCEQVDMPPGTINVLTGLGAEAGAPLVEHPDVAMVAFTGSDYGGQKIYQMAAQGIKPVSLELGGKSPNIVFDDANLDAAVMGVVSGIFAAAGQSCVAGSRVLVQRSVHDRFVERLVEVASAVKLGDPMDPATQMGPIANLPQYEKILSYIAVGRAEGANCVLGGEPYVDEKNPAARFVPPTVFTGVDNSMRLAREEVFGPVASIIAFSNEEDALEIANDTIFGLAAGVWTSDIARAMRMSSRLKAGTVWVNTYRAGSVSAPFGGFKRSGIGREGGLNAMKSFLQVKSVMLNTELSTANPFVAKLG